VIHARRLTKRFGTRTALAPLDLDVADGAILVVTGPNGSGKTTLLRLLVGLGAPTGGELEVGVERERLGYLGHEPLVYRELTAVENLSLFARLYRVDRPAERIDALLARFGLADARDERVSAYSRGMTQRLALCRSLLHEPELLVLDEPHTALDAAGAGLLDGELAALAGTATLVISTHDPERLHALATDRVELGGR